MLFWNYDCDSYILEVRRTYNGVVYKVHKECTTAKTLAFWLKHYQMLDLDTFVMECNLMDDCN